jgi:ketosteroid isomerase-like protein
MSRETAESFMHALRQAEESGDVGPLAEMFAEDAKLENPARSVTRHGREGARQFWQEYLSAFDHVRSEFTEVNAGDGFAALEWRSGGTLPTGTPVSYRGVSIIQFDPDGPGPLRRFCTYYDSATFLPEGTKAKRAASASAG